MGDNVGCLQGAAGRPCDSTMCAEFYFCIQTPHCIPRLGNVVHASVLRTFSLWNCVGLHVFKVSKQYNAMLNQSMRVCLLPWLCARSDATKAPDYIDHQQADVAFLVSLPCLSGGKARSLNMCHVSSS